MYFFSQQAAENIPKKYLNRKNVLSYDLRLSSSGKLCSLQFISPNGDKKFLCGGRKKGCLFTIGPTSVGEFKRRILLCEGYSTGASIYQATGEIVIVCGDCGNLLPVALDIQSKYPEAEIIICADNDAYGSVNRGLNEAVKADDAIGARIVYPVFKDIATRPTDWNDLHRLEGIDRVREQISGAFRPIGEITK